MNEGQWVLVAFGAVAIAMISLPVATVWTMTRPGSPEKGLDGEISHAFLASAQGGPQASEQAVPAVGATLPKGMPETTVFQKLAASGFTCATDADAATCFRSHSSPSCRDDWTVRLIFSDNGTIWSTKADRRATCL